MSHEEGELFRQGRAPAAVKTVNRPRIEPVERSALPEPSLSSLRRAKELRQWVQEAPDLHGDEPEVGDSVPTVFDDGVQSLGVGPELPIEEVIETIDAQSVNPRRSRIQLSDALKARMSMVRNETDEAANRVASLEVRLKRASEGSKP